MGIKNYLSTRLVNFARFTHYIDIITLYTNNRKDDYLKKEDRIKWKGLSEH